MNPTKIVLCELNIDLEINIPINAIDLGYIDKSNIETQIETYTTAIIRNPDKKLIHFITDEVKTKIYLQYYYMGIIEHKHLGFFSIVKVTPQIGIDTPGAVKTFPYESVSILPKKDVKISKEHLKLISSLTDIKIYFVDDIIIPAGRAFKVIEIDK